MKPERALRQDGRVFDLFGMIHTVEGIHPGYRWEDGDGTRKPNGKLRVFRLLPSDPSLPSFEGRWDGCNRDSGSEKTELDIDIIPGTATKSQIRRFKKEILGYRGHHARAIKVAEGHAYNVDIRIPSGTIFVDTVSFALGRRQAVFASTALEASLTKRVNKPLSIATRPETSLTMTVIRAIPS